VSWRVGTVIEVRPETPNARTLVLDVPDWPGNAAGQHLDLRLTAPDGYQAARSYSIATSGGPGSPVELAVDEVDDGEVSPYLVQDVVVGDQLELRGPVGRWFLWRETQTEPAQLIGGGSGCVPLMAMARAHATSGSTAPMRMLYSARAPRFVFYRDELDALARSDAFDLTLNYTREAPDGWPTAPARLTRESLERAVIPAAEGPSVYVCGPTPFVESVADLLVGLGHPASLVKTERFGGA